MRSKNMSQVILIRHLSLEKVVLMLNGIPIVQVPLLNFQTFAPEKISDLKTEIAEGDTCRWKFHVYDASKFIFQYAVQRWASWLTHFDLRAIIDGGSTDGQKLRSAIIDASLVIKNPDYQDALVDAWMSWVQDGEPAGSLSTERLLYSGITTYSGCLIENGLMGALVLYHDPRGIAPEGKANSKYTPILCGQVQKMAMRHFIHRLNPHYGPKDPLQLSDDNFCKKYHSHHKKNLPCYKTKSLPEER